MSMLMFQAANALMSMGSQIGVLGADTQEGVTDINSGKWAFVGQIVDAINTILYPVLILVATAGVIYAIVLGVNLARAESADAQKEAKKRIVNAIVGLVSIIALILLLKLFCNALPNWIPQIEVSGS